MPGDLFLEFPCPAPGVGCGYSEREQQRGVCRNPHHGAGSSLLVNLLEHIRESQGSLEPESRAGRKGKKKNRRQGASRVTE